MAYEANVKLVGTILAGADLTTYQGRLVDINSSGKVVLATNGGYAVGVLANSPNLNEVAQVQELSGVANVATDGTLAMGELVAVGANGKATQAGTSDIVLGRALETSATDGAKLPVVFGATYRYV
jgi:hypothetical protein